MKVFFDFLPIALFFAAYKVANSNVAAAASFATRQFGFLVSGGTVDSKDAPILLATLACMAATLVVILIMKIRGTHIDKLLWANVVIITAMGAATIWFHNETFIKWKPTLIYWVMGLAFAFSEIVTGKSILRSTMEKELTLPDLIWQRLSYAWGLFFLLLGLINLYVAYHYSTDIWVDFKMFGGLVLMGLFAVGQFMYVSRHLPPAGTASVSSPAPLDR